MGRAEFDRCSPREVGFMVEAWRARERRMDHRFGVLATLYAESKRDPEKRGAPWTPSDFFPSLEAAEQAQQLTPEQETDRINAMMLNLGGVIDGE